MQCFCKKQTVTASMPCEFLIGHHHCALAPWAPKQQSQNFHGLHQAAYVTEGADADVHPLLSKCLHNHLAENDLIVPYVHVCGPYVAATSTEVHKLQVGTPSVPSALEQYQKHHDGVAQIIMGFVYVHAQHVMSCMGALVYSATHLLLCCPHL